MLVMISKRGYVTERFRLPCQNLGIDLKIDHVFEVLILREYRNRELPTEGWKIKGAIQSSCSDKPDILIGQ